MPQKRVQQFSINDLQLKDDEPSLLFAIKELITTGGINFEEWFNEWKALKQGKNIELTRRKIKPEPVKPKFYDITSKDSKSGCKFIWYMPDGEEASGIPLTGTDLQIIEHIVQMEYEGDSEDGGVSGKNSKPPLAGLPAIKLVFMQPHNEVAVTTNPVKGEKLIRLVGYTANDRIAAMGLAEKLNKADVKKIGNNIAKVFFNYRWEKGQGCLSYSGMVARYQGLEGYAYCKSKADGKQLFTAMLKVFDRVPDPLGFNWSESTEPTKKFPKQPSDEIVLDKKVKTPVKRPVVGVVFDRAELILDKNHYAVVKQKTIVFS